MFFRLKTWLRIQMEQIKLTGLALMLVLRNIQIDTNNIIVWFTKINEKNILLLN